MNNIEYLYSIGGASSAEPRVLSNVSFTGESLDRLLIGPGKIPNGTVNVANCAFYQCVIKGEFRIAQGVVLEDVLFEEVRSPDLMIISAQSLLDRVVIKGGRGCAGLWVKPSEFKTPQEQKEFEEWATDRSSEISLMLDFSELEAKEVEILGLPVDKLRWNRERHVALRLERFRGSAWRELNFPPGSFWSLRLKRLELFKVAEGVFSLPEEKNKKYSQTKLEMLRLIEAGVLD